MLKVYSDHSFGADLQNFECAFAYHHGVCGACFVVSCCLSVFQSCCADVLALLSFLILLFFVAVQADSLTV